MTTVTPSQIAMSCEQRSHEQSVARLGMWVFLATEVLFFGGLMLAYTVYRHLYPAGFQHGSSLMAKGLGTINTAILLTSSLFAALAVRALRLAEKGKVVTFLVATACLGIGFDGLKFYEYGMHIRDHLLPGPNFTVAGAHGPAEQLFFVLYFIMTGVHALHVIIGVAIFSVVALKVHMATDLAATASTVENAALYWHFVDVIWVLLYPLFYLAGGSL